MKSDIDQIKAEIARRELAGRSPLMFQQHLAWHICEPGKKFHKAWYHEYIDEILMAASERQLKRIVINLQPRAGKSGLISVAFPCWLWLKNLKLRFIQLSHSFPLSMKLAEERLTVLQSEAYRSIAPNGYSLLSNRKKEILNNERGYSYTMNPDRVTGVGCNFMILDDITSSQDAMSDTIREGRNLLFENALLSRLDDKNNDVIIIVMQRLHRHDLCGYLADESADFGFEYFPIKTEETSDKLYIFPYSGRTLQRYEGDLLNPARENREYVNALKKRGSNYWNLQHQQDDTSTAGSVFQDEHFSHHDIVPDINYRILSIDTATTDGPTSSRWCFTLFGSEEKSLYKARNGQWTLMDCYAKAFVYVTGRDVLAQYIQDNHVDLVLIEKKSSGQDLCTDLPDYLARRAFRKVKIETTVPIRDKLTRAYLAVPYCDLISIPNDNDEPWFKEWKQEVFPFPAQWDDRVDCLTQFIRWLKFDEKDALPNYKTELVIE